LGRRKRGWKAASSLSLGDLRRMMEAKEAALGKLASRRADLAEALAEVEADLKEAGGGVAVRRGPGRPMKRRGPGRHMGKRGPGGPPKTGAKRRRPGRPKGSKNKKKRSGKGPGRPTGSKGQSPLHNAIRAALRGAGQPMKLADIAEKVKAGGYEPYAKNFALVLGLRVSEMADVKRIERGVYAMK